MARQARGWHRFLVLLFFGLPAASAFAWLWPDWLHAGHPLVEARSRPSLGSSAIKTKAVAAAAAATPSFSGSSFGGPDVCRPTNLQPPPPPEQRTSSQQDWPELRYILDAIREQGQPRPEGRQASVPVPGKPLRPQRVEGWWERALSPKLRLEYEDEARVPTTVQKYVWVLKRLFKEAAPAIFVEGAHAAVDNQPHPVVDTGGVATPLPLATTEQLQSFLYRYHDVLTTTAQALPGGTGKKAVSALGQLKAFADGAGPRRSTRQEVTATLPARSSWTAKSSWVLQEAAAGRTTTGRRRDLWARLVSPPLEEEFKDFQRYRERPAKAISATIRALRRLFLRLPLEPYEEAALSSPLSTTAELRRFLRRHYFDIIDLALEEGGAAVGGAMAVDTEEALAELWLFVLVDRPDAIAFLTQWQRQLEADERAAAEVDRMVLEWEGIAMRALGEAEVGQERERVLGEMLAWARRVKGSRGDEDLVDTEGVQPALGSTEGGLGAVDALKGMVEAVGDMQEESKETEFQGFGRPKGNHNNGGNGLDKDKEKEKGKRARRRFRRPWVQGQNGDGKGNGNGGG